MQSATHSADAVPTAERAGPARSVSADERTMASERETAEAQRVVAVGARRLSFLCSEQPTPPLAAAAVRCGAAPQRVCMAWLAARESRRKEGGRTEGGGGEGLDHHTGWWWWWWWCRCCRCFWRVGALPPELPVNFDDRAGLDSETKSKEERGKVLVLPVNKSGAWFGKVGSKDTSGKFRIDAVLCALSRPCA